MESELSLTIPMSRYKRELNSLSKKLARGEIDTIYVSINTTETLVCISPERYQQLTDQLSQLKNL